MQYSVMLYFNNFENYRIGEYVNMLKDCSNNSYLIDSHIPPHITIGMWNSDDGFLEKIEELAHMTNPFELLLASIGIFNSDEEIGHVFLAPVKNPELVQFHKRFYELTKLRDDDDEFDRVYQNDNIWVPHVTIGYSTEKENLGDAITKCTAIDLPQKAVVTQVAVAHCCPFKEIKIFNLNNT